MKKRGMINELQHNLNLHSELIDRTIYFEPKLEIELKTYKIMFEDFQKKGKELLNELRGFKE